MNTPQPRRVLASFALLAGSLVSAHAIVLTDPTLYSVIDPSGGRDITINATGSTAKSTLESLAGFGVVQDFTGFTAGSNTVAFTDPLRSDLRISFSGNTGTNTGNELANASFATSGSSAVRVDNSNIAGAMTVTGTLDFGSWNGSAFDSTLNSVSAVGFTLSAPSANLARLNSITANFLDAGGNVLSTQSISGVSSGNQGFYFGYSTGGAATISSVEFVVSINANSGGQSALILGLDDIGFTSAIPEPSTAAALLGLGALGLAALRRRARR